MTDNLSSLEDLRIAVRRACEPTYVPYIEQGRSLVLGMSRPWVMQNIERTAVESLNLNDFWEYRRLLELLDLLDARDVLGRFISLGFESTDLDVREAATDYRDKSA